MSNIINFTPKGTKAVAEKLKELPLVEQFKKDPNAAYTRYELISLARYHYLYADPQPEVADYIAELMAKNMTERLEFPKVPARFLKAYRDEVLPNAGQLVGYVQKRWEELRYPVGGPE